MPCVYLPRTPALVLALLATAAIASMAPAAAQTTRQGVIGQISPHVGEMMSERRSPEDARETRDTIRFEPIQMIDELLGRDDIVFLMRHGPTDWSHLDAFDVAPSDCARQRVQSAQGRIDTQNFGALMADAGLEPGAIAISEWCRNRQTVENLMIGFRLVDPDYAVDIETDTDLDLLLSLQGAADVTGLRARISSWTAEDADGPLLIVTHYPNIEKLTTFNVFEGEMLIVDPKRDNRVLSYLRLRSAGPDVGHFVANADVTPAEVTSGAEPERP